MEAPHFNVMCSVKPLEDRTLIMLEREGWAYSGGSPLLYFITSNDVMIHCCEQTSRISGCGMPYPKTASYYMLWESAALCSRQSMLALECLK